MASVSLPPGRTAPRRPAGGAGQGSEPADTGQGPTARAGVGDRRARPAACQGSPFIQGDGGHRYACGLSVHGAHAFTCKNMHDTRVVLGIRSRMESTVNSEVAFLSLSIFTAQPPTPPPAPGGAERGATSQEPPGPHFGTELEHLTLTCLHHFVQMKMIESTLQRIRREISCEMIPREHSGGKVTGGGGMRGCPGQRRGRLGTRGPPHIQ